MITISIRAALLALLLLLSAGTTWATVTHDAWPFDERALPASAVRALNAAVGIWLLDHGDVLDWRSPRPVRAVLTAEDKRQIEQTMQTDARFKERAFLNPGSRPVNAGLPESTTVESFRLKSLAQAASRGRGGG